MSDSDVEKDLEGCKEMIKANRKPAKERVQHNKETRLRGALTTIVNICLEDNKDDPKLIEEIKDDVTAFEIKLKRKYLGLKVVRASKEIKDKLDDAAAKATA